MNKKMKDLRDYLIVGLVVLFAIVFFLFAGEIISFIASFLIGWKGALILLAIAVALALYFTFGLKFRKKALIYAFFVIAFTMICIWLAVNFDAVWDFLQATLGTWGTIGVVLVLCGFVGLGMMML